MADCMVTGVDEEGFDSESVRRMEDVTWSMLLDSEAEARDGSLRALCSCLSYPRPWDSSPSLSFIELLNHRGSRSFSPCLSLFPNPSLPCSFHMPWGIRDIGQYDNMMTRMAVRLGC